MRMTIKVLDWELDALVSIIGKPLSAKQEFEAHMFGKQLFTPEDFDFLKLIAKKYCSKWESIWIEKKKGEYIVTAEPSWKIL